MAPTDGTMCPGVDLATENEYKVFLLITHLSLVPKLGIRGDISLLLYYSFKAYWLRDAPAGLTFNNCTFCPHCIYVFCIYLRTNSDLSHLQHKMIGLYNRDEKCLQRGTDWVFK